MCGDEAPLTTRQSHLFAVTYPMESFVARHVLIQLWYNGDMDGNTVSADGKIIPEQKFLGFLGRRERVSLLLYVVTLVPALVVDDLGPVLSLTGSLGASCIAYIGPGLVYFGINGDDFLNFCSRLLKDAGCSNTAMDDDSSSQVELPNIGDSQAMMNTSLGRVEFLQGRKPWWWWVMGFPLWTAIARLGAHGTRTFLSEVDGLEPNCYPIASIDATEEIVGPNERDYYIAMIQIVFGTIAMVIGVASNIYVEVSHKNARGARQECCSFIDHNLTVPKCFSSMTCSTHQRKHKICQI